MEKEYSKLQLEDKALKSAALYFGQELLPYLNVNKKIRKMLPTEQIHLEAVRATEDILFEMEDDTLLHLEFESVEVNEEDLRRFRMYDAYSGMIYKKPVVTYVVCSGKTKNIKSELYEDINTYRIIPLQMKDEDSELLFQKLRHKKNIGEKLLKSDLVPLLLTPLMSGERTVKERILEVGSLLNSDNSQLEKEEKQRMESVLYAFACKFLTKKDLEEIKEILGMTVLGEMIWNDGYEEGSSKKLISLVCRKLQKGKKPEQIAEELEEELELISQICEVAEQSAPEYNCDEIYQFLKV